MYIELHASSAFSFLDGASLPEALVERAAALGYPALALLDRDGVYGAPRFHLAAKKAGLKAIIGAELTVAAGSGQLAAGSWQREAGSRKLEAGSRKLVAGSWKLEAGGSTDTLFRLPVLVESQQGYKNLCRLVTAMK